MGHVKSVPHLFNLIMGKLVGSNGYHIACKHEFSAYTIFWGAPIIFCTPNIADNRNFAILLTQDRFVNLDKDADMHLAIQYEELRLRVVNDPVGQSIIVHLFLQLFVSHFNSARTFGVLMWHGALASTCPDWKTCKGNPLLQKALGRTLLQNEYGWQRLPKSSGRD